MNTFIPMNLLCIPGSARAQSSNIKLLEGLSNLETGHDFYVFKEIGNLPLFSAGLNNRDFEQVIDLQKKVKNADGLIFCTPEYLHNLPACVKNLMEWLTESGELHKKKTITMTFCPNPPRGEKAMQSLLWSLQALDANVLASLPLYQNEVEFDELGKITPGESKELLIEALDLF